MIEKKITTTFYQTNKNSLSKEENSLVDLAINSLKSAYAPYSRQSFFSDHLVRWY